MLCILSLPFKNLLNFCQVFSYRKWRSEEFLFGVTSLEPGANTTSEAFEKPKNYPKISQTKMKYFSPKFEGQGYKIKIKFEIHFFPEGLGRLARKSKNNNNNLALIIIMLMVIVMHCL